MTLITGKLTTALKMLPGLARAAPSRLGSLRRLLRLAASFLLMAGTARAGGYYAVHQFDTAPDAFAQTGAQVAFDSEGNLYGTTLNGGKYGNGSIYRLSADGVYATLHSFSAITSPGVNTDGINPVGGLVAGPGGVFYGTTRYGGANGTGEVFSITTGNVFTPLYSFTSLTGLSPATNSDGANPQTALIFGSDGYLYGTAYYGGANGYGTVFRISTGGAFNTIYSFQDGSDGANPNTALTLGSDNLIYGTTLSGDDSAGTAFRIAVAGGVLSSFHTIHTFGENFSGATEDAVVPNALTLGPDDNLYGTSNSGGSSGIGTIFRMPESNNAAVTVLHSFSGADGQQPYAPLLLAPNGLLYGAASFGGSKGAGEIFSIDTSGDFDAFFSIPDGKGGYGPQAPLALAPNNIYFYGTTEQAGAFNDGIIFKFTIGSLTEDLAEAGTYAGLFGPSGNQYITLTLSANGAFSGKAVINGATYGMAGSFDPFGQYFGTIDRGHISVYLTLGAISGGLLRDFTASGTIDGMSVTAYHAAYTAHQTASEVGKYTVEIRPGGLPAGYGSAALTVGNGGAVSITGKLANGSAFSSSGVLVGGGAGNTNQFLVFEYNSTFQLAGPLTFSVHTSYDFDGTLNWVLNPNARSHNFASGINGPITVYGLHYTPPPSHTMALAFPSGTENASLTLSGGGISTIDEAMTLSDLNKVTDNGPDTGNKVIVTLNAAKGTFTGSFLANPPSAVRTTFQGVLYQDPLQPQAVGFFLSPVSNGAGTGGPVTFLPR